MKSLKNSWFKPSFSHIYIEKEASEYSVTTDIISHFPKAEIVEITHYKDVFCRARQNYSMQKQSPQLILAVKKKNVIYGGSRVCQDFGNHHFYYTSSVMNCVYDCAYCYLQGMYPSANIVVFVNLEDIFKEADVLLKQHPVYLCISYDTDLLALEPILGYVKKWVAYVQAQDGLTAELRTKSANFKAIRQLEPVESLILAWTLSPHKIQKSYEHHTPTLEARLSAILEAAKKGWNIRLCFDPILYEENWRELYREFIDSVFKVVSAEWIKDVSLGVFRVSHSYLKQMRKQRSDSLVLSYPYETEKSVSSYGQEMSLEMISYVSSLITNYIPKEKLFIWSEAADRQEG